jgi:hypothetical protein
MMGYARACQQLGNFAIHPLIHTLLESNLAQSLVFCQGLPVYGIMLLPSENLGEREMRK